MTENMEEETITKSKSEMKKCHIVAEEQMMHLACKKNNKVETVMMSKEEEPMMESDKNNWTMSVNGIQLGKNDDLGGQSNEGSNTEKMKARVLSALQNRDEAW